MKTAKKLTTSKELRESLNRLLPGYKWTIHKSSAASMLHATGIQSRGFNRLSTIAVNLREENWYEVSGYGFGKRSQKMGVGNGSTLAQAVRSLQDYYKHQRDVYTSLEKSLEGARGKESSTPVKS